MAFDPKQYTIDYIKKNQRQFMLKCNRQYEQEMIEWLESKESMQAYLKELIQADMDKHQKGERK